jgi:hypothetical protein
LEDTAVQYSENHIRFHKPFSVLDKEFAQPTFKGTIFGSKEVRLDDTGGFDASAAIAGGHCGQSGSRCYIQSTRAGKGLKPQRTAPKYP